MTHSATLLGMPAELFDLIVESTDRMDLMRLRLVSRECAAKVLSTFEEEHIQLREVKLATESSFANAVKIVEHPTLGAAIRELRLVDDAASNPAGFDFDDEEDPEKGIADLRRAEAQYDAQQLVQTTGRDRRLLADLLAKCQRIGVRKLSFWSWNSGGWDSNGNWHTNVRDDWDMWRAGDDHCFMTVMLAIISSGASFDTFTMSAGQGAGISICRYGADIHRGSICTAALSHFEALDLVLCASEKDDNPGKEAALEFLTMMTKLKIRSLEVIPLSYGYDDDFIRLEALTNQDFPAMESLELDEFDPDWEDLVEFLGRQKNLRTLRLRGGRLYFPPRLGDSAKSGLAKVTNIPNVTEENVKYEEMSDME